MTAASIKVDAVKKIELKALPPKDSEDAFAGEFVKRHGNSFRYDKNRAGWWKYDGTVWRENATLDAQAAAIEMLRELGGGKPQNSSARMAENVLKVARTRRGMALERADFDVDDMKLGTPAGTVNLMTGKLLEPYPSDLISMVTAVHPQEGRPEKWLKFLSEAVGDDEELIDFLQEWCGYNLTGLTREQVFLFVFGEGGNGKSVFVNTVMKIMGDYAQQAPTESFMKSKFGSSHSTDLAMLQNRRFVAATETEEGHALAAAKIKQITGSEPITARFMRQDFFTYIPKFKITMIGNFAPILNTDDAAMRRRVRVLEFNNKPAVPNPNLEEDLKAEWPMILQWMIDGALRWRSKGLSSPSAMTTSTDRYFTSQDFLGEFLEEECYTVKTPPPSGATDIWSEKKELFMAWQIYCRNIGEDPGTQRSFTMRLLRRGYRNDRGPRPDRVRRWRGVQLRRGVSEM